MNILLNPWTLLGILIVHYIADFIMQPDAIARIKWQDKGALIIHTLMYSLLWFLPAAVVFIPGNHGIAHEPMASAGIFVVITFPIHTGTDYYTSKLAHYYFIDKKDSHNGFLVVGFDQILHYVQLYLTFKLLL